MRAGDRHAAGGLRFIAALLAIERNDSAQTLRESAAGRTHLDAESAQLKRLGGVLAHLLSGVAHIQAGRLREAASELDAQRLLPDGETVLERTWRHFLEGEMALARGDLEQAATAFSAAQPATRMFDAGSILPSVLFNVLPSRDGLARVAIARGDVDGAIKIYRDLLRYGPHSKWVAPLEPLYVLQVARLLEKRGDRKAALDEYQRFLNLWKNADAELPELAEARRAVARLT
jgi:tetratricopeptide (TPR) repeat protein